MKKVTKKTMPNWNGISNLKTITAGDGTDQGGGSGSGGSSGGSTPPSPPPKGD